MRLPHPTPAPARLWHLLPIIALAAALPSAALASPDCSHAGPRPSAECAAKMDDCKHTSIVYVLAVMGRKSGLTEDGNLARLTANAAHEAWYGRNRAFVKDTVHQIYTNQSSYGQLRAGIAPNVALALAKLIAGCNADPSVTVETP